MRQTTVSLAIIALLGAALTGCSSSPVIRTAFTPDDCFDVHVKQISDLSMMFPNTDHKETQMVFHCCPSQTGPDQPIRIEAVIQSIDAVFSTLGGMTFTHKTNQPASDVSEKNLSKQEKYTKPFLPLEGSRLVLELDPVTGRCEFVDVDGPLHAAMQAATPGGMFGGDQVNMFLTEDLLRDYLTGGLLWIDPPLKTAPDSSAGRLVNLRVPDVDSIPAQKQYTVGNPQTQPDGSIQIPVAYMLQLEEPKTAESKPPSKEIPKTTRRSSRSTLIFKPAAVAGEGTVLYDQTRRRPIEITESTRIDIIADRGARPGQPAQTARRSPKIFYTIKTTIHYDYNNSGDSADTLKEIP